MPPDSRREDHTHIIRRIPFYGWEGPWTSHRWYGDAWPVGPFYPETSEVWQCLSTASVRLFPLSPADFPALAEVFYAEGARFAAQAML